MKTGKAKAAERRMKLANKLNEEQRERQVESKFDTRRAEWLEDVDFGFVLQSADGENRYWTEKKDIRNGIASAYVFCFESDSKAQTFAQSRGQAAGEPLIVRYVRATPTALLGMGLYREIQSISLDEVLRLKETWEEKSMVAKKTDKKAASKPRTPAKSGKEKALEKWKVGTKTKAGCEILGVKYDPNGKSGKTTILTVKCQQSGKPFNIFTQDAFQCKFHPDYRTKKKSAAKAKAPAKAKPAAKTKGKAKPAAKTGKAKSAPAASAPVAAAAAATN